MKKIIFMLAAFFFCFQFAGFSQVRLGISAGVSAPKMESKVNGDARAGFITGLVLDAPLCKKQQFTFHPTISYVQKGQSEPPIGIATKNYLALRYAEFTTDFLYNSKGKDGGFFIGGGPSIAFNLPSKRVIVTDGKEASTNIKFGKEVTDNMKGFDYGLNGAIGYRAKKGFFVYANYNRGLRNLVAEGQTGKLKNYYVGFQLGFYFNNNITKAKK